MKTVMELVAKAMMEIVIVVEREYRLRRTTDRPSRTKDSPNPHTHNSRSC
jgi:hypothetical protein